MIPPPPTSTLFPYTTLFRSRQRDHRDFRPHRVVLEVRRQVDADEHDLEAADEEACSQQHEAARPERLVDRGSRALPRSEEHTSELQSLRHLVCRLLLEKKKQ